MNDYSKTKLNKDILIYEKSIEKLNQAVDNHNEELQSKKEQIEILKKEKEQLEDLLKQIY